ncbi:MAG TPA: GNAT family N-acetyltransferase [Pilimelia sp.]|nr:GNAT family N-acetyltransferase [Pilimelia sp.]
MPNPSSAALAAGVEQDEFGTWLVVREITDQPTRSLALRMFGGSDPPLSEVRDWHRRGRVFALTDPAAPPAENVVAAAVFVPVDDDTVELSGVAVAEDYGDSGLLRRLLEPVSHILAARGMARIVVRPDVAARLGGLSLRPAQVAPGGQDQRSELDL